MLRFNLVKKLSELNSTQYVEPLIESLGRFTCQHDYLHEHRMHRSNVIFRQFYGMILQAFQVEIRYLRLNGDPVNFTSMSGLRFKVLHSKAHDTNCEFWHVAGVVFDISGVDKSAPQ